MLVVLSFLTLFAVDNSQFFKTVEEQRKQGYRWEQIECRTPTPGLPALVITTPTDKKLVCNKLTK